jgi:capsular exopolysaccharide synthesis family protein
MSQQLSNQGSSSQTEIIDIRELLKKYIKKWHWFLLSIIICLIATFVFIKKSPVKYDVQTDILLRKDAAKGGGLSEQAVLQAMGLSSVSKDVEDEIQIIQSKTLIREVIKTLEIQTEYYGKKRWKFDELYTGSPIQLIAPSYNYVDTASSIVEFNISQQDKKGYKVKVKYSINRKKYTKKFLLQDIEHPMETDLGVFHIKQIKPLKENTSYKIVISPTESLVESYNSAITVASVNKKSNAISISYVSSCIPKSRDILNKIVEVYNMDAVRDKNLITRNAESFIKERLKLISLDLSEIEQDVERYKKQHQMANIEVQAELLLKTMSEYQRERLALETQLSIMSHIENSMKDKDKQFDFIPPNLPIEPPKTPEKKSLSSKEDMNSNTLIPSSASSENSPLQKLIQEYNTALINRIRMLRTTNERNPIILQTEQELTIIRENILASIASSKEGIAISLREVVLKDNQFEEKLKNIPTQEREFVEIKRQQKIKEELFLFLLQKQEETALTLASAAPSAKTIDPANASTTPVSPKQSILLLVGLVIGIMIPVVIIYLLDFFNNKIENKNELKAVKVPFLGSIAQVTGSDNRVVVREGVTSPVAEMFRLIRTNLRFMLGSKENSVILVTSSISGEGKSFVTLNLALSFALMKKKTIVVGLDIRSPKLAEYLEVPREKREKGSTLYLADETVNLDSIIQPSPFSPFLTIVPAGPIPPNPSELLMLPRLEQLFEELKKEYDYIIVDSAPVAIVSDTYLLNRITDATIYVVRENYTPKDLLPFVNEVYEKQRLNNIAMVLNGSKEKASYGYGSYLKQKK